MSAFQVPVGLVLRPGLALFPQGEQIGPPPGTDPAPGSPAEPGSTEQTPKEGGQPGGGGLESCLQGPMLLIGVMLVFFYFFLIRPQQKQEKARKALLSSIKKNDRVITTSGIHATVVALDERTATLKIDEKGDVRVKFERSSIGTILRTEGE